MSTKTFKVTGYVTVEVTAWAKAEDYASALAAWDRKQNLHERFDKEDQEFGEEVTGYRVSLAGDDGEEKWYDWKHVEVP